MVWLGDVVIIEMKVCFFAIFLGGLGDGSRGFLFSDFFVFFIF